jgi:hypothetical protein
MKMGDENTNKIIGIFRKRGGLTITELVRVSKLSRHLVLKSLTKLEGADKVAIRSAGMAKIYTLKKNTKKRR